MFIFLEFYYNGCIVLSVDIFPGANTSKRQGHLHLKAGQKRQEEGEGIANQIKRSA